MAFSEEERRQWHETKRTAEIDKPQPCTEAVATCLHCGNAFGIGEGSIHPDAPMCDVCIGD